MPARPKSICRHPGCNALTASPGYCTAHAKQSSGWNRSQRKPSSQRGYGYEWQQLRHRIMVRDNGLCQVCYRSGRITAAREVDHIVPKSRGGGDEETNLQAICVECHKVKTANEAKAARS